MHEKISINSDAKSKVFILSFLSPLRYATSPMCLVTAKWVDVTTQLGQRCVRHKIRRARYVNQKPTSFRANSLDDWFEEVARPPRPFFWQSGFEFNLKAHSDPQIFELDILDHTG